MSDELQDASTVWESKRTDKSLETLDRIEALIFAFSWRLASWLLYFGKVLLQLSEL